MAKYNVSIAFTDGTVESHVVENKPSVRHEHNGPIIRLYSENWELLLSTRNLYCVSVRPADPGVKKSAQEDRKWSPSP